MTESDDRTLSECANYTWRKSSKSISGGHCVEAACTGRHVLVRDSQNSGGVQLRLSPNVWGSFIQYLKNGE